MWQIKLEALLFVCHDAICKKPPSCALSWWLDIDDKVRSSRHVQTLCRILSKRWPLLNHSMDFGCLWPFMPTYFEAMHALSVPIDPILDSSISILVANMLQTPSNTSLQAFFAAQSWYKQILLGTSPYRVKKVSLLISSRVRALLRRLIAHWILLCARNQDPCAWCLQNRNVLLPK